MNRSYLMKTGETQTTVARWAQETFGEVPSVLAVAIRANTEMAELLKELLIDDKSPKALEEIADVFIVLYRAASLLGGDVYEAIDRKMAINRAREWDLDGKGQGYHVRHK